MKRFRTRKRRLKLKYRLFLYLLFICFLIKGIYSLSSNIKFSTNEEFLKYLLVENNSHLIYDNNFSDYAYKLSRTISNIDPSDPKKILSSNFGNLANTNTNKVMAYTNTKYIENDIDRPLVYIYSTHQSEKYENKNLNKKMDSNVIGASKYLASNLEKLGVDVIVEEADFIKYMTKNNLDHNSSYKVSRVFLLEAMKENKFDLIIDLHRDAIPRNVSTTTLDGAKYAKVLFVIGTSNPTYETNLEVSKNISDIIAKKYPSITRGIFKRNSVYNQDLASNIILLEMGADVNEVSEIVNTIPIVADAIASYLGV